MDFGLTDEAEITAVANSQADWAFDPPPADRLAELGTKYAKQVHVTPLTAMWYAPMNSNIPPFNNEKARRGGQLRDRPQRLGQDVRRPGPGAAGLPGACRRDSRRMIDYCPCTKNPGASKYNGAGHGKGQGPDGGDPGRSASRSP